MSKKIQKQMKQNSTANFVYKLGSFLVAVTDSIADNQTKQSCRNSFLDKLPITQQTNSDYNQGYKDAINNLRFETKSIHLFHLFKFPFIKIGEYIHDERFDTDENINTVGMLQKIINVCLSYFLLTVVGYLGIILHCL